MKLRRGAFLLFWTIVCVDVCLCQRDCTAVDCPALHNCIETATEIGDCCPTCLQRGCTCEGYQYYDCVHAGFGRGKVPEQKSYFVDSGSTECSCPQGGGNISCRFILCLDIPRNCIDIVQREDGCPQCGRVGCTHGSRKYEAGHSFQMDRCQVCHCPKEGGKLMCSPIFGCDLNGAESDGPVTGIGGRHSGPVEPFPRLTLANTLPLYKHDSPSFVREDYDSSPTEPTSSTIQNLARPLESTAAPLVYPHASSPSLGSNYDRRHEIQEPEEIPKSGRNREDSADPSATRAQSEASATERAATGTGDRTVDQDSDRTGPVPDRGHRDGRHPGQHSHRQGSRSGQKGQHTASVEQLSTIQFRPTSASPIKLSEDEDQHQRQPQTLSNYQAEHAAQDAAVSAKELVKTCCETGEKWASTNGHCDNMDPPIKDRQSICWTAQQQCCRGSLGQSQCLAGISAARAQSVCEDGDECGIDSYKDCCSCCSLGLQFRSEGHRCHAHRHLGFQCRHVFLTCCHGDEWEAESQVVRERPAPRPTPPPTRVSDSPYAEEAFSIGEDGDRENAVEDMDECLIYAGNICDHRCVNTPGSYRCECFPGYVLQEDAFSCAQETVSEENRLKEDDRAAATTSALTPPSQPLVPLNPCEGNNPCEQQCSPVGGWPQCSCSSGFHLGPDGRSCQDVNECLSARACQPTERCVNTAGSYTCQRPITCPAGYRASSGACQDMDECSTVAQACSPGFNCINTPGSYMCQRQIMCSRGYHASPNGSSCIDVDECQSGLHRCGEGQLCRNLLGSYRCECHAGYQYDSFRRTCVDVNECWRYPGRLCAQTCENTPGSYECSCTSGFRLSGDGKSCEDVNECVSSPCSQECTNIYGSYHCYCRRGYYLREDAHTCEDIDECSQSIGHLCTYRCVNVPGSYRCACPELGFTMSPNGRSCRDIDECDTGAHNCSLAQTCYNVQGGYHCLSLDCPPNYRKVSNTRCERMSCPNSLDCQNSPLRITYYYLSFQANIVIPAQIFRIGPSPAYAGDNVIVSITQGNEENYFSIRKLNAYTGALYLQRQVDGPRNFLVNVEMKLWRQGTFTTFHARIYVFITAQSL